MNIAKLTEIEERAKKATSGPWVYMDDAEPYSGTVLTADEAVRICETPQLDDRLDDMEFIAHARTDIPALCKALRESMAREAAMADIVKAAQDLIDTTEYGGYDSLEEAVEKYDKLKEGATE